MESMAGVRDYCLLARGARTSLRSATSEMKNAALLSMANRLIENIESIIESNRLDLKLATEAGMGATALDRLRLDEKRVHSMASQLTEIALLEDPVGEISRGYRRPNGLKVSKVRVPLGVVAVIYENRPNVTSDAAGLCIKSGNVALLRGSSTAIHSNSYITSLLQDSLEEVGINRHAITLIPFTDRKSAIEFMRQDGLIDLLVPRGGKSLIQSIKENATVPYVIDGDGNCHIYVDASADIEMAISIVKNAKMSRPGVCNAAETLLLHESIAKEFLDRSASSLQGVEIRGDETVLSYLPDAKVAAEEDWANEFLDLVLAVRVVPSIDEAILHIERYGTGHSEAIVTNEFSNAQRFVEDVDAAATLVNASTRFVDGNELGLGAEIGISTQKLHARGPLGLRELTTEKYVILGCGQIR
ncbi:MAG: glutamate-5-semialdehyde dehydrogenase [Actinomycetota bacterium]|nr:glutamate-5-semialdehyde dehydrogenase [Actinomycetota bacterium]